MTSEPIYRQIYRAYAQKIESGELPAGAKLPSTAELSSEFSCSSTAVNTAIVLLANSGLIYGQPGIGRFVTPA